MSWVVDSAKITGETGTDTYERQRIRINLPPSLISDMSDSTQSYLFVTYDVGSTCAVEGGGFEPIDTTSAVVPSPPGQTLQQTGGLFRAGGRDGGAGEIVLRLTMEQQSPVKWRAVAVVMQGDHVTAKKVDYHRDPDGTSVVNIPKHEDPEGGEPASVMFFGSQEGVPSDLGGNATHVATVVHGGWQITAYTWSTALVETARGGPWFTALATASVRPPKEVVQKRKTPTHADDFWALRAMCEGADFFVINNDLLSQQWDVPGSTALQQGDSVLFNHTDEDGTRWSITDVKGWWTTPPVTLNDLPNSGYLDGSFPLDGRYNYRSIEVSGAFLPGVDVSVAVPRQRLLRSLDAVRGGALWVAKEPVWAKQSWVYLENQPTITTSEATGLTIFSFNLRAVDPIKYHAGTVGFQQVELIEQSANYLGRTYSEEKKPRELTGDFIWSASTSDSDPGAGKIASTGASFDDVTQVVNISATTAEGNPVDLSQMVDGDALKIYSDALILDAVVTGIEAKTGWWKVSVGNNPDGESTTGKPATGSDASATWFVRDEEYSEEAVLRGTRFRPIKYDESGNELPPDPKDLRFAPNPYRRYQDKVVPASVAAVNAGTYTVRPRLYIYGPCTNPAVVNVTTGEKMQFRGSVLAGEVLVADCQWRIVSLRSATTGPSLDPRGDLEGVNRRWMLDFSSTWLSIVPSRTDLTNPDRPRIDNILMMSAASLGEGSKVVVAFRSGWLG